jgi:hypothetical protein
MPVMNINGVQSLQLKVFMLLLASFGGFQVLKKMKSVVRFMLQSVWFSVSGKNKKLKDVKGFGGGASSSKDAFNYLTIPFPGAKTQLKLRLSAEECINWPLDFIFIEYEDGSHKHQVTKHWPEGASYPTVYLKPISWIK